MLFSKLCRVALLSVAATRAAAMTIAGKSNLKITGDGLQDLVTWDEHSLFVRGERILFYSGEFHPFRLPVPSLWLDVFQKIKALGYNGVSVYWDWALLEGKQGDFSAEGVFALEPFFEAAKTAGIYLLARPGPYINAEASGGGFPGWLQRNPALPRTRDPGWLAATENYSRNIASRIAKAQITNGGPVILLQPENEYSQADLQADPSFPDSDYWLHVENQFRDNGIVVPLISNDAYPHGYFAPGPPARYNVSVNIYGHDGYPLGFDCANPYTWPANNLPTYYGELHLNQSKSTPYSIVEFQGGSFDPWGGLGFFKCGELIGPEFQRVFYKNDFSFGVTIFNIYMTYGGTNWGNLGHPGGYTSYDYGAVISEGRQVNQEKYSQAKLLANFLQASPSYLTALYQNNTYANGSYTGNLGIATTAVVGEVTKYFVVRQAAYNSLATVQYNITLPTSKGNMTIPRLGGSLSIHGRDSKVFVTDYDVGGATLLYSTAEIFTWKVYGPKRVLVLYSGPGETNELAFLNCGDAKLTEGDDVKIHAKDGVTTINYHNSPKRRIVELSENVAVYLLDRQDAYNYWVIDLPNDSVTGNHTNNKYFPSAPIVKAGYLLRTVEVEGQCMRLTGDLNATTPIEIIGGAPNGLKELTFNGESLKFTQSKSGVVSSSVEYAKPAVSLPDLGSIPWKTIDSLPEIQPGYDDSLWTVADLTYSNNTARNLTTPTSLYAGDYGYNAGNLLYRGHFTATGKESTFYVETQGGSAYGHSIWLNNEFVGSLNGADYISYYNHTYTLPATTAGKKYIITILIDNQGLDENGQAGSSEMKNPRGVLDFNLSGHSQKDISWKLTGNLHGEDYEDRTRGPLNEGGLYAERNGYHLPGAPTSSWKSSKGPGEGISSPGVAFYSTTFDLDLPSGYDIPLAFSFTNATTQPGQQLATSFRSLLFVNGYQFGKYINNIGPQTVFPVPEGILNYHGSNYVAVSLWALGTEGAKVDNFSLIATSPAIQSGYGTVGLSPLTGWVKREGAY